MYGISNSQQQGGGGGGAASYKAIKSSIAVSDWEEVARQPYFVGSNAMEWATTSGMKSKSQDTNLGLVGGENYTITVVADGQTYTKTETASLDMGMTMLLCQITDDIFVSIYDGMNVSTMEPGTGSMCLIDGLATITTSFIITSFVGEGLAKTIQATISDSAIKVNSAVTMYTSTSEKIAAGEKTNGSITLTAPSVPNVIISYSLEIVGTDTEGLFELINGYVPEITPSAVPQWNTIFESATPVVSAEIGNNKIQPGQLYRVTTTTASDPDNYDVYIGTAPGDYYIPFSQVDVSGSSPSSIDVIVFRIEYTSVNSGVIHLSPCAVYAVTAEGITNFSAFNNVDAVKFTKLEVYR